MLATLFNLCLPVNQCDAAWTNASAHAAWSLAVPALAQVICKDDCRRIASAFWIAGAFVYEDLTHSKASSEERRTDLASKILPCLIFNLAMEW